MQQPLRTHKIIQQVANRLHWVEIGRRFYHWLLITGVLYGLLLAANRLLGIDQLLGLSHLIGINGPEILSGLQQHVPIPIAPATLLVLPLVAAIISLIWHRRPTLADAARRMDQYGQTKDLFLTYSLLDQTAGGYQSLVAQVAEKKAPLVKPKRVIPFSWTRHSNHVVVMGILLLLSVLYLPHLDPLGRVAEAARVEKDKQQLLLDQQATTIRIEQVHKGQQDEATTSRVDQAIHEMTESFRKMKPNLTAKNLKKISQHQRQLGKKWTQWRANKLRKLLNTDDTLQDFGGKRSKKLRQWQQELQAGGDASLRKELSKLSDDLQALAAEKDPIKRKEMLRKLKQRLQDVEQFASKNAGSPELAAAMQRAMRQLEASQRDGSLSEMLEDMKQSLDLAKLELVQISKLAQELQKLEQSLEILQMAKRLNRDGQMDGEVCSQCQSLADYAELFEQMMGASEGSGPGMGNRGFGEGGEAPEDDSIVTDYKTERSRSALRAGKVLLSMQAKGISDSDEVKVNYQELVDRVKQGVNEAILQEQVPPGYHHVIRSYFDTADRIRAENSPVNEPAADDGG